MLKKIRRTGARGEAGGCGKDAMLKREEDRDSKNASRASSGARERSPGGHSNTLRVNIPQVTALKEQSN